MQEWLDERGGPPAGRLWCEPGAIAPRRRHVRETEAGDFTRFGCNHELVDLDPLSEKDTATLLAMIGQHQDFTGSTLAAALLSDWERQKKRFVKVIPRDYKRAMRILAEQKE